MTQRFGRFFLPLLLTFVTLSGQRLDSNNGCDGLRPNAPECRTVDLKLKQLEEQCPKAGEEVEQLYATNTKLNSMALQMWPQCNPKYVNQLRQDTHKVVKLTQDLNDAVKQLCVNLGQTRQEIGDITKDANRNFNLLPVAMRGCGKYMNRTKKILRALVPAQQRCRWNCDKLGHQGLYDAFWHNDTFMGFLSTPLIKDFIFGCITYFAVVVFLIFFAEEMDNRVNDWLNKQDGVTASRPPPDPLELSTPVHLPINVPARSTTSSSAQVETPKKTTLKRSNGSAFTSPISEKRLEELNRVQLQRCIKKNGWYWQDCGQLSSSEDLLRRAQKARAHPNEVLNWDIHKVAMWLSKIGDEVDDTEAYSDYAQSFRENEVSGKELLYIEKYWKELDIPRLHQKKILSCRDELLCTESSVKDCELRTPRMDEGQASRRPSREDDPDDSKREEISPNMSTQGRDNGHEESALSPRSVHSTHSTHSQRSQHSSHRSHRSEHTPRPPRDPLESLSTFEPISPKSTYSSRSDNRSTPNSSTRRSCDDQRPSIETSPVKERWRSEESDNVPAPIDMPRQPVPRRPVLNSPCINAHNTKTDTSLSTIILTAILRLASPLISTVTRIFKVRGSFLWLFVLVVYLNYPSDSLLITHCAPELTALARKTAQRVGSPTCMLKINKIIVDLGHVESALDESVRLHKDRTISNAFKAYEDKRRTIAQAISSAKIVQKGLQVANEWHLNFAKAANAVEARNVDGKYSKIVKEYKEAAEAFRRMISELHAYASVGESSTELYKDRLEELQQYFKKHDFEVAIISIKLIGDTLNALRSHSEKVQKHIDHFILQMNQVRESVTTEVRDLSIKAGDTTGRNIGGAMLLAGSAGIGASALNLANVALWGVNPAAAIGISAAVATVGAGCAQLSEYNRKAHEVLKNEFTSFDKYLSEVQRRGMIVGQKVREGDHMVYKTEGLMEELKTLADTLSKRPVHVVISPAEHKMIDKRINTSRTQLHELQKLYKNIRRSASARHRVDNLQTVEDLVDHALRRDSQDTHQSLTSCVRTMHAPYK